MWILVFLINLTGSWQYADQPGFKGGSKSLDNFISGNLVYPEYARQNCIQGTIRITFKLTSKGKVFESGVQKGYGIDLDKEALRIVRLTSGKWVIPAGYDTTLALVLPINFSLKEYHCEQRSKEEISAAISAYRSREDLTRAVTNFYQKKNNGQYDAGAEQKITDLKAQLGYDEQFIDRTVRQAQTKVKQGDKESACEDFQFIHNLGSPKADKLISQNCR